MPERIGWRTFVQWLHIMAVATAIGGTFFIGYLLLPALGVLSPENQGKLVGHIVPHFSRYVWVALPTFFITGVIMWFFRAADAGMTRAQFLRTPYTLLLVIKVLLAHVIAITALMLTLPGFPGVKAAMPGLMRFLPWVAFAIFFIAAYLRRMKVGAEVRG
jgi:uncharacterized membrane protein